MFTMRIFRKESTILRRSHQLGTPKVKDGCVTLEINEREEEAIGVDLTEPIAPAPRTPKKLADMT